MRLCPACGEENPDRFRLCGFCGTPLTPPPAPVEARKTVTVVFSDLAGSTALGEQLDPETLREVLDRYFGLMRGVLEDHGGVVEKFIGDAIMAVFGLPRLHEDDALRAVRAAWAMRGRLADLNEDLARRFGVTLANRTGVNTGEVIAGEAAGGQRLATGDAVNVAARLEQAAPVDGILIGPATRELVRDAVELEPVEPLTLKGKSEPMPAYLVRAVAPDEGVAGVARRHDLPLVGRDEEVAAILGALGRAAAGRSCQVLTVLAPAGIGKTRLVREAGERAAGEAGFLYGRCLPYGEAITYWPLAETLRAAAGLRQDMSAGEAQARLAAAFAVHPNDAGDSEAVAARLASAIGLTTEQFGLAETFWAARKAFEALAAERPLMLVFDDVHWAAPTFLELLEHLAGSVAAPVLIVCAARPEFTEDHAGWLEGAPNAARLPVLGLPVEAGRQVALNVARASGVDDPSPAWLDRIVAGAAGNPLYAEQMVSMVAGAPEAGSGEADGAPDALPVPPSISALLAARLDRLPAEEVRTLEVASVEGLEFHGAAVRELADAADWLDAALDGLRSKLLVEPAGAPGEAPGAVYRFHHALVREVAYQRLLKRSRADLHQRFAGWLEGFAGLALTQFEEIDGYHLEQAHRYRVELGLRDEVTAGLAGRAFERLAAAGRRAHARGDLPAAANMFSRALDLLPEDDLARSGLGGEYGEVLQESGRLAEAGVAVARAEAVAVTAGDRRLVTDLRVISLQVSFGTAPEEWSDAALREAQSAIPVFEAANDHAALARAWRLIGSVHGSACQYGLAGEASERAVRHARLCGFRRYETRGLVGLALSSLFGPTPVGQAVPLLETLVGDAEGDQRVQAMIRRYLSLLCAMVGEFDRARGLYQAARATLDDLGARVHAASTAMFSGPVELLAGDPERAVAVMRPDYEALLAMGERTFVSTAGALLAEAVFRLGDLDEAESLARASASTSRRDDIESQYLWRGVLAKVVAARGALPEAGNLAEEAVRLVERTDSPATIGEALLNLAAVRGASGEVEGRQAALRRAADLFQAKGSLVELDLARSLAVAPA